MPVAQTSFERSFASNALAPIVSGSTTNQTALRETGVLGQHLSFFSIAHRPTGMPCMSARVPLLCLTTSAGAFQHSGFG